ncbi:hypothetical protein Bca4012_004222 [Brassica carinata]|uniref:Helicase ATP-binding domain-containing protein n=2 Tax=Brassica cretica TaxID=69181 RepID=A0ABQ7CE70_BRACR|nr:hypothetical protein F2Q69_00003490 [Brassica cretica]KAF3550600.1 hypothetical protein DY000_02004276 [Brassica cretica]
MGGESNEGEMGQTMKMMKVGSQELKLHQCFRMQRFWYCLYQGNLLHKQRRQYSLLERGVHAMSGTPGRVYEMIKRGSLQTKYVKILIIDRVMEVRC